MVNTRQVCLTSLQTFQLLAMRTTAIARSEMYLAKQIDGELRRRRLSRMYKRPRRKAAFFS